MKISLVLATVGRVAEVQRFLDSLHSQSYRNFELIVVDQNPDVRLAPLLAGCRDRFPIVHVRSTPGLSRARNVGLTQISGDVVAFPDDDCWYPADVLEVVHRYFAGHAQIQGLTGRSLDPQGMESGFRFGAAHGVLDRLNVWWGAISYTIFLRRAVVEAVGGFDETLGVGANTQFGSGEETDYLVRAIAAGFRIQFDASVAVHHPVHESMIDGRSIAKAYSYGCGMGRVLAKHHYPAWFKLRAVIRPLGGGIASALRLHPKKSSLHLSRCAGRIRGMLGSGS